MKQRITGFDIARALAVFGMVVVNFKIATGADQAGPHWLLDVAGLLDGRAAATFVVLAGVGVSLLSAAARQANDVVALARHRVSLLKRALFLFVVGLLYTPLWPADILHFYGLYITIGSLFLSAASRRLAWAAGAVTGMFVVLILTLDYEQGWDWQTLEYSGLWTVDGMIRHLFFNGFHPVFPWVAFLLIGMLIGRLDLRRSAVRRSVFLVGFGTAGFAEASSWLLIRTLATGRDAAADEIVIALFGSAPMPPMPLYVLAGAGTAAMLITACVALTERYPDAVWCRPLIATGQLALTLYVAHVVIGMGILEALGRLGGQSPPFAIASATVFCLAAVVFAHFWRLRFRRGPVEWVMRRATSF